MERIFGKDNALSVTVLDVHDDAYPWITHFKHSQSIGDGTCQLSSLLHPFLCLLRTYRYR